LNFELSYLIKSCFKLIIYFFYELEYIIEANNK